MSKLRIHTDETIAELQKDISRFADSVRSFTRETCQVFHTTELRSELAKRTRRITRMNSASLAQQGSNGPISITVRPSWKKEFNANTAKLHVIGDYPVSIVYFGSTESYSTANVWYILRRDNRHELIKSIGRIGTQVHSVHS